MTEVHGACMHAIHVVVFPPSLRQGCHCKASNQNDPGLGAVALGQFCYDFRTKDPTTAPVDHAVNMLENTTSHCQTTCCAAHLWVNCMSRESPGTSSDHNFPHSMEKMSRNPRSLATDAEAKNAPDTSCLRAYWPTESLEPKRNPMPRSQGQCPHAWGRGWSRPWTSCAHAIRTPASSALPEGHQKSIFGPGAWDLASHASSCILCGLLRPAAHSPATPGLEATVCSAQKQMRL